MKVPEEHHFLGSKPYTGALILHSEPYLHSAIFDSHITLSPRQLLLNVSFSRQTSNSLSQRSTSTLLVFFKPSSQLRLSLTSSPPYLRWVDQSSSTKRWFINYYKPWSLLEKLNGAIVIYTRVMSIIEKLEKQLKKMKTDLQHYK